jgi:hypothetical protein
VSRRICAVLVPSTDAYRDLWRPFLFYFNRYWPDCPYRVLLGANYVRETVPGATILRTGRDGPWGTHVRELLARVGSGPVIVIMPDYFLEKPVASPRISECVALVASGVAPYVRLVPSSRPRVDASGGVRFVPVVRTELYAISLVATVWSMEALRQAIRPSDSPWSFERRHGDDALPTEGALSTVEPLLYYDPRGALVRGRWTRKAQRHLRVDGMGHLLAGRSSMTRVGAAVLVVQSLVYRAVLTWCPGALRAWYRAVQG